MAMVIGGGRSQPDGGWRPSRPTAPRGRWQQEGLNDMPAAKRPFDLVVFGASGFTGTLVAEYLAARSSRTGSSSSSSFSWTIAGRSLPKLQALRARLLEGVDGGGDGGADDGGKLTPIVADVGDASSLRAMCRQARVVVSTVGPFAIHGAALVEACVAEGTDYADITGETLFVRQMIDRHDAEARRKGVRIVSMAGYDSVPSDIVSH